MGLIAQTQLNIWAYYPNIANENYFYLCRFYDVFFC